MKQGDRFILKDGSTIQLCYVEKGKTDNLWSVSNVLSDGTLSEQYRLSAKEIAINVV